MLWNARGGSVLVGGTPMPYVCFGHGAKQLVILPGLSDGLTTVEGKALLLAPPYRAFFDQFTVYLFSRRSRLPQGHTIRDMADDQATVMRELGMDCASIMGVSQGGMIAQQLAIDHPELVEQLVLAVSAARISDMTRACVEGWVELARRGDHKSLMIDAAEKSYSSAYLQKYRWAYPVLNLVGRPKTYDRFLANASAILGFDALDELCRISCPTLILAGENDRVVGMRASEEMHERIAGSKLFVYPGLGHAAYEEAPDFNDRVFRFLQG